MTTASNTSVARSTRRDGAEQELSSSDSIQQQQQRLAGEMEVAEPWARQPPTLPMDLLLDIIARCADDAKTVVRCGLVCKDLRSAMRDGPGFHARLGRRRGGFDPGLLVAVSYRLSGCYRYFDFGLYIRGDPIVVQPPGRLHRLDTNLLETFDPAATNRDGLLVLRAAELLATWPSLRHGLHVCNTITGHVTSLPSTSIGQIITTGVYQPALLSVDDAAAVGSYKLLVMCSELDGRLLTQTFSSQEGEWGAPREIHIHNLPADVLGVSEASCTAPAVVGRSIHWLCYTDADADARELIILAVRAESGCATVIKLPQELLIRMGSRSSWTSRWTGYAGRFMLAATPTAEGERRLSIFAAETFAISMWTLVLHLHPDEGSNILWSQQEVILKQEIGMPLPSVLHSNQAIRFSMFGERSGTVLFWMQTGDANYQAILVQLNLVTKKTLVLWRGSEHCCNYTAHALLHETSLLSVLKSF